MDQKQLQEKIAFYYSKLPPAAQTMFSSMKWMDTLGDISKKYTLTDEQVATIGTETTLVLLGIIDLSEYEQILKNDIKITPVSMEKMVGEINTLVLNPIRSELTTTFEKNVIEAANTESNKTAQALDPRFANIPQEVQSAIAQSDYQKKLYEIGTRNKLQVNKMAALEDTTVKFIIGKISSSQYESELALTTDLPAGTVRQIATEVNTEILSKIRELMKKSEVVAPSAEDEVPLPPYAQKNSPQPVFTPPTTPKTEAGIYANSGIEIMTEDKNVTQKPDERTLTKNEDVTLEKSDITIVEDTPIKKEEHILPTTQTQKSVLDGIEHPDDIATSIIGDKLRGSTKSINMTTDYSLPKIGGGGAPKPAHDPYHEVIE